MKRIWFLVFALSLGVNAGLLYVTLARRGAAGGPEQPPVSGGQDLSGPAARGPQSSLPGDFETIIRSHLDRMTQDLKLEEAQRKAIGAVHEKLLPEIIAERQKMEALRGEVTARYAGPEIDPKGFRSLVRQVSLSQGRIDSLVTEAMLAEAAVLSYEQRQRYVRLAPWGHPLAPPEHAGEKEPPVRRSGQPQGTQPPRPGGQQQPPPPPGGQPPPPPRGSQPSPKGPPPAPGAR